MSMVSTTVRKTRGGSKSVNKNSNQKKLKLQAARHLEKMLDCEKDLMIKLFDGDLCEKSDACQIRRILDKYKIQGRFRTRVDSLLAGIS